MATVLCVPKHNWLVLAVVDLHTKFSMLMLINSDNAEGIAKTASQLWDQNQMFWT